MVRQPTNTPAARGGTLQTLERGVSVLEALATSSSARSAADLATSLELDRTVVHRILRTLEAEELVVARSGRYVLGARTLQFGNSFLRHDPLRRASLPLQIDLLHRQHPDEPWALSVLVPVGAEMTPVTQIWAPNAPLDSLLSVPDRLPIAATASGRCVLAALTSDEVSETLGTSPPRRLTARLASIRRRDFVDVVGPEEAKASVPGMCAIAALVRSRTDRPIAGLTMSGPGLEPHLTEGSALERELRRTADEIGRSIG